MNRIVPEKSNPNNQLPSWIKPEELIQAGRTSQPNQITKEASVDQIVTSYACSSCGKIVNASSDIIKSQMTTQKYAGKSTFDFSCPKCSGILSPYKTVGQVSSIDNAYASQVEVKRDLEKESSTYNTYVDRHLVYKAIDSLQNYAHKMGMFGARVRYLNSEHTKQAGQAYPMLNNINCEIEWMYGRNQKAKVEASIEIDQAGKYKFPRVFKFGSVEYPFEKESVQKMQKEVRFDQLGTPPQKSSTPTFKKPDVSRFRQASLKKKAYEEDLYSACFVGIPLTRSLSRKIEKDIEDRRGDSSNVLSFIDPSFIDKVKNRILKTSLVKSINVAEDPLIPYDDYRLALNFYVELNSAQTEMELDFIQDLFPDAFIEAVDNSSNGDNVKSDTTSSLKKKAYTTNTTAPIQRDLSQFTQGQKVDALGKPYNVKNVTPGQGVTLSDPQTGQETVMSEENAKYLQPTAAMQAVNDLVYGIKKKAYEDLYYGCLVGIPLSRNLSRKIENDIENSRGGSPSVSSYVEDSFIINVMNKISKNNIVKSVELASEPFISYDDNSLALNLYVKFNSPQNDMGPEFIQNMFPRAFIEMTDDVNATASLKKKAETTLKKRANDFNTVKKKLFNIFKDAFGVDEFPEDLWQSLRNATTIEDLYRIAEGEGIDLDNSHWNGWETFSSLKKKAWPGDPSLPEDQQWYNQKHPDGMSEIGGNRSWYKDGELHRLDGPATEHPDGHNSWYYEGEYYGNSDKGYNLAQFKQDLRRKGKIASLRKKADIGYNPQKPQKDETGHDKYHGVPFSEDRDINIGVDEFPVDEKKETSSGHPSDPSKQKGYRIPFKEMDKNQVKNRERFNNQDLLHLRSTPVRELDIYKKELEKEAVLNLVGLRKKADLVEESLRDREWWYAVVKFYDRYVTRVKRVKLAFPSSEDILVKFAALVEAGCFGEADARQNYAEFKNDEAKYMNSEDFYDSAPEDYLIFYNAVRSDLTDLGDGSYWSYGEEYEAGFGRTPEQAYKAFAIAQSNINGADESNNFEDTNESFSSLKKKAGDEDLEDYEKDVKYKGDYRKAPPGFPEPPTIEKAKGGVSEMITKFKNLQKDIETLQASIDEKKRPFLEEQKKFQERMNTSLSPLTEDLKSQQNLLQKYFGRLWKRLDDAKDKIVWYENSIIGNWEQSKVEAKPASLAEILKKAEEVEPELVQSIEKIKALIENERTNNIISKVLVEYPVSKVQEPKLKASMDEEFASWFDEATDALDSLEDVLLNI